ncbi:MAG: hypothetical protein ACP5N2_03600 [Candidatus Nanoarchaeia archaeon]
MHWTKAETIIKKLLENPSNIRALPYDAAKQLIDDRLTSLIKLYHPDKSFFKGYEKFSDLMQVQEEITKYSFKTIYTALKSAPGSKSTVRTDILEAKVKQLKEGVKINITDLVENFESGQYFFGLANNAANKFVLISNPPASLSAKAIGIEDVLNDNKVFSYAKKIIEQSAVEKIPKLESKIKANSSQRSDIELQKTSQTNNLNILKSLKNEISNSSLLVVKKTVDDFASEYSTSERTINSPKVGDIQRAINNYIHSQNEAKKQINISTQLRDQYSTIELIILKNKNISSIAKELLQLDNEPAKELLKYLSKAASSKAIKNSEAEQENKIHSRLENRINTTISTINKKINRLKSTLYSEELFVENLKDKLEFKEQKYLSIIKDFDERIKKLNNLNATFLSQLDAYRNLSITPSNIKNHYHLCPDLLQRLNQEIMLGGTTKEKVLLTAREFSSKNSAGDVSPRYMPLVAIHIDETLSLSYCAVESLLNFPDDLSKYKKTNKKILGVMNTAILEKPGIPYKSKLLTTQDLMVDDSVINPHIMKSLIFFENLHNNIEENHINSRYGLVSIDFKDNHPAYRLEGILSSPLFSKL